MHLGGRALRQLLVRPHEHHVATGFLGHHQPNVPGSAAAKVRAMEALSEYGITADRDGMHVLPPEQLHQSVTMQLQLPQYLLSRL